MLRTAARNFSIEVAQTLVRAVMSSNHRPKSVSLADDRHRAAGFFNLLFRALGEAMRRNLQRLGYFAVAEHDNVMLRLLNDAAVVQQFRGDFFLRRKSFFQRFQAYFNPLLLENIGKAALWQTTVQGHLAAFEADLGRIARTRFLSLFTAARSLAETAARPSAQTLLLVRRSFSGT